MVIPGEGVAEIHDIAHCSNRCRLHPAAVDVERSRLGLEESLQGHDRRPLLVKLCFEAMAVPIDLHFRFTLRDGAIARLVIEE